MKELSVRAIKSKIITSNLGLFAALKGSLNRGEIRNGNILVITSKVIAVAQGRVVKVKNEKEFQALVQSEADQVLGGKHVTLTLKNNIFIPWAGVDRSNTKKGTAVLWPDQPYKSAEDILRWFKKEYGLKKAGVIIVDSFCVPLRKGVTGIAIGYAGFNGVVDQRGKKDLYGNILKVTRENIADSLASIANMLMGQGKEQTPFAIISNAPVKFLQKKVLKNEVLMNFNECLYKPLYKTVREKKSPK